MTKKKPIMLITLILVTVLGTQTNILTGQAQVTVQETRENIIKAFEAVAQAQERGGNITGLSSDLNNALELLEEGNLEEANQLANTVIEKAQAVAEAGARANTWNLVKSGLVVAVLLALSVLVWVYGSSVFWDTWIQLRKGWIIKVD